MTTKTLVAMLHLEALPGAPLAATPIVRIAARAANDARILVDAGFDAVLVENFGDRPFHPRRVPAITVAAMTVVAATVIDAVGGARVGINVLRNDASAALAVASATGASFIRVNVHTGAAITDQGVVEGCADATMRERARLNSDVRVIADVHVKHATPLGHGSIADAARDCAERGLADGLIVSGPSTGLPTSVADLEDVRAAVPDRPLWIGSGVTPHNAGTLLELADGAIVGTTLERAGKPGAPLDRRRIRAFLRSVGRT